MLGAEDRTVASALGVNVVAVDFVGPDVEIGSGVFVATAVNTVVGVFVEVKAGARVGEVAD